MRKRPYFGETPGTASIPKTNLVHSALSTSADKCDEQTDKQTDRQTDRYATAYVALACYASYGKQASQHRKEISYISTI